MEIDDYRAEAEQLVLDRFGPEEALRLGQHILRLAEAENAPVVISIRNSDRIFFHAALPGSHPQNDHWAARKGATALMFGAASMLVTLQKRAKGQGFERDGLPLEKFALSGGAVPIRVRGTGIVAVATVSGLPEEEDHNLVVRGIRALMKG